LYLSPTLSSLNSVMLVSFPKYVQRFRGWGNGQSTLGNICRTDHRGCVTPHVCSANTVDTWCSRGHLPTTEQQQLVVGNLTAHTARQSSCIPFLLSQRSIIFKHSASRCTGTENSIHVVGIVSLCGVPVPSRSIIMPSPLIGASPNPDLLIIASVLHPEYCPTNQGTDSNQRDCTERHQRHSYEYVPHINLQIFS